MTNYLFNDGRTYENTMQDCNVCRVYLAVCDKVANRGLVIQQGGAKALIPLALEGSKIGKQKAAHALAKIAITNNPAIAFPGQRVGGMPVFCWFFFVVTL